MGGTTCSSIGGTTCSSMSGTTSISMSGTTCSSMSGTITSVWVAQHESAYPETVLHWYDSSSRLTRTHPIYSDLAFYNIKTLYLANWLKKNNPFFPKVVIWGASRISRLRAKLLLKYDITIENYIDIHKKRQLSTDVIYYKDIPNPGHLFILCYIKEDKARKQIQEFLKARDYHLGIDYLLVS